LQRPTRLVIPAKAGMTAEQRIATIMIKNNLATLKKLISEYEEKYHRKTDSVRLLAVSKGQTIEKMTEAFEAGQLCFGENYLQEALEKMAGLSDKAIEWHFIGPIQSNKTRKIAEHFSWVHSVDSLKIAKRLNDQRPSHLPPLNICIEVNVSEESTKSGVLPDDVISLAHDCLALPQLKLRGLMAIPAILENFADQRREYHKLFSIWTMLYESGIPLDTLSMGMSNDFEAAIAEGSTIIRVGRGLFGDRS
jgi:pyridoxal phosphate enzyme (YggS family)